MVAWVIVKRERCVRVKVWALSASSGLWWWPRPGANEWILMWPVTDPGWGGQGVSPAPHLQGRGPTSEDILVYLCVMGNWWDVLTAVFMNVDVFIVSIEFRRCMFASVPSSLKWYIWPAWKDFTFCFLFAICLIYISGACPSFATRENFTSTCNQQHSFRGHKNNGNSNSMKFN